LTTLEKIASKHKDWLRIVKSFGCEGDKCEDLCQEMYIKVHTLISKDRKNREKGKKKKMKWEKRREKEIKKRQRKNRF
jgi:hypothetical protein